MAGEGGGGESIWDPKYKAGVVGMEGGISLTLFTFVSSARSEALKISKIV